MELNPWPRSACNAHSYSRRHSSFTTALTSCTLAAKSTLQNRVLCTCPLSPLSTPLLLAPTCTMRRPARSTVVAAATSCSATTTSRSAVNSATTCACASSSSDKPPPSRVPAAVVWPLPPSGEGDAPAPPPLLPRLPCAGGGWECERQGLRHWQQSALVHCAQVLRLVIIPEGSTRKKNRRLYAAPPPAASILPCLLPTLPLQATSRASSSVMSQPCATNMHVNQPFPSCTFYPPATRSPLTTPSPSQALEPRPPPLARTP